jgi:diguanylate cyclase (GGDEF)-like protein
MSQKTRITKLSAINRIVACNDACLVQIYGPNLGRRFHIRGPQLTVGRDRTNDIVVDLDNVSRKHCKFSNYSGKVFVSDLGSTNGTYLNDKEVLQEAALRSGDLVKVGGSIFKFLYGGDIEALYHEEIYRMAIIDGLTEIYNKRYFVEFLEREMARCHRYGRSLSLVMFDIDHFKKINDQNGHLAGDHVLRELANIVRSHVRKEECLARYGGEEFALVLPESGREKVRIFCKKLLRIVSEHDFVFEKCRISVTISIGVSDMTAEMSEPEQFIKLTDAQLYRAKNEGRNRMCG